MSKQIKIAQELKQAIVDIFYPIGSVYISVNDTDPSTKFGGTWARIMQYQLLRLPFGNELLNIVYILKYMPKKLKIAKEIWNLIYPVRI